MEYYRPKSSTVSSKRTRVLLVNVYNLNGELITHDVYYRLFSQYGRVQRILIFEKSKVWKTFVELSTPEEAERAKKELHETQILKDGSKLNIFSSDLEKINLQNSNTGGIDYTTLDPKFIISSRVNSCPTTNSSSISKEILFTSHPTYPPYYKDANKRSVNLQPPVSPKKSKSSAEEDAEKIVHLSLKTLGLETDIISQGEQSEIDYLEANNSEYSLDEDDSFEGINTNMINNMMKKIDDELGDIDNKLPSIEKRDSEEKKGKKILKLQSKPFQGFSEESEKNSPSTHSSINDIGIGSAEDVFESYVNPLFLIENKKSKVIFIKNLDVGKANGPKLCNLFGCFGNIEKVLLLKSKNAALVEYTSEDQATQGKDYMNKKVLFGKEIKIFYSNYDSIDKKHINKDKNIEELYSNPKENFRYKSIKPSILNPPSKVLHISNLKTEAQQNIQILRMIFGMHGIVEGIKFLDPEQTCKKLPKKNKIMCLIKFSKLEESFTALSELHGRECFGKLKISFTRSVF